MFSISFKEFCLTHQILNLREDVLQREDLNYEMARINFENNKKNFCKLLEMELKFYNDARFISGVIYQNKHFSSRNAFEMLKINNYSILNDRKYLKYLSCLVFMIFLVNLDTTSKLMI